MSNRLGADVILQADYIKDIMSIRGIRLYSIKEGGTKERTYHKVKFYYLLIYLLVAYLKTMSITYTLICQINGSSEKFWYGNDANQICRGLFGGIPAYL
jgi:hypothetical protein